MPSLIDDFANLWRPLYGETAPLGHALRRAHPSKWCRLHSLPQAKRYPTTPDEVGTLLNTQVRAASFVISSDVLAVFSIGEGLHLKPWYQAAVEVGRYKHDWLDKADDVERFFAMDYEWKFERTVWTLLKIANDEQRMLFLDKKTGSIFAPYDGGVDLFFTTEEARDLTAGILALEFDPSDVVTEPIVHPVQM